MLSKSLLTKFSFLLFFLILSSIKVDGSVATDFFFLLNAYNGLTETSYLKEFEFITKIYFRLIYFLFDDNYYFLNVVTIYAVYSPLILFAFIQQSHLNILIAFIGLIVMMDSGHVMQFCRTYFCINLLPFFFFGKTRSWIVAVLAILVHQSIGLIYLLTFIIKKYFIPISVCLLIFLILQVRELFQIGITLFNIFQHSFWVFKVDLRYTELIILYSPLLIMAVCFLSLSGLVFKDLKRQFIALAVLLLFYISLSGYFSEVLLRLFFYFTEIFIFMQILVSKRYLVWK